MQGLGWCGNCVAPSGLAGINNKADIVSKLIVLVVFGPSDKNTTLVAAVVLGHLHTFTSI